MIGLSEITNYFKEVSQSLKFQLSATVSFGVALLLVWSGVDLNRIYISILFLFPLCMFLGTLIEKICSWRKHCKEARVNDLQRKLGRLGQYQYTYKHSQLWADKVHNGLGWEILVNEGPNLVFLREPVCMECKTSLLTRTNKKVDGFYLECTDCKKTFEVGDIGEARSIANASLQGDVRRNEGKFFTRW